MKLNVPVFATLAVSAALGWIGMGWIPGRTQDPSRGNQTIPQTTQTKAATAGVDAEALIKELQRPGHAENEPLAALQLAKQIAPSDFARFLEADHLLPGPVAEAVFRLAVVRRWLTTNPRAAANWCAGHDSRLFTEAVKEWTRMDPAIAEAFAMGMPLSLRDTALTAVAGVLASSDPDCLIHRTGGRLDATELAPAFRIIAQRDTQALANLAEKLPSFLQSRALWEAATAMAAKDLNDAISWAQKQKESTMLLGCILSTGLPAEKLLPAFASLFPEKQKELLEDTAVSWASRDPEGLLKVLRTDAEAGIPKSAFISVALNRLIEEGPVEALATFQRQLPDHPEWWVKQLAESWGIKDPAAAHAWAAQLPNNELREEALSSISSRSGRFLIDEIEIIAYFADKIDELTPEERTAMLDSRSTVLPGSTPRSPEFTIRNCQPEEYSLWLAAQPPSENTNNRIEMFIAEWGAEEPAAAAAWLDTLPDSEGKQQASHDLLRLWTSLSPKEAKAWQESAGLISE